MPLDHSAVQATLYQRLTDQITDVPTFSHVPQKQAYPYIRIDSIDFEDDGTKTMDMWEAEITLSVFHKDVASSKPVAEILKRIHAALHDQDAALAMAEFKVVLIRCTYQTAFQAGKLDDHYYHGIQRYRALIQEL